ncbi:MAG: TetR/AcrR family transcriptional regulator [Gemmatimonadetes bacterium]|nr:TetR/AcrR family transcriptional regulator [Gemmatimonadota bacterium]
MVITRDPAGTRQKLLEAAFHEMHRDGFQSASLDHILETAGVTKGALYYHFENKHALGYAVVDELIHGWIDSRWVKPLEKSHDPVTTLRNILEQFDQEMNGEDLRNGCPLNNLINEMSAIDDGFRLRLSRIVNHWRGGIAESLARGQGLGTVRADIQPRQAATMLIAIFEGITGLAKNAQNAEFMRDASPAVLNYLESMRPVAAQTE